MGRTVTVARRRTLAADDQESLPPFLVKGILGVGLVEISQGIKVTGSNIDDGNTGRSSGRQIKPALQAAPEQFRGREEDLLQGEEGKAGTRTTGGFARL
jgi:hypothetical protein